MEEIMPWKIRRIFLKIQKMWRWHYGDWHYGMHYKCYLCNGISSHMAYFRPNWAPTKGCLSCGNFSAYPMPETETKTWWRHGKSKLKYVNYWGQTMSWHEYIHERESI